MNPQPSTQPTDDSSVRDVQGAGDVRGAEVGRVLRRWLAAEFNNWFYARLDGARFAQDARVPLGRVFVDLPCQGKLWPRIGSHTGESLAVAELLFEPDSASSSVAVERCDEPGTALVTSPHTWIALIGGPGQGKTTVGHFLLQLHRASLLGATLDALTPEQRTQVELFAAQARAQGFQVACARWPLHVSLPRCAAWLGSDENPEYPRTLAGFICARIARLTRQRITDDDLLRVLDGAPWCLVLDGLDEVGSTEARGRVVEATRAFARLLRTGRGRVLVATRPTGYGREFGELPTLTLRSLDAEVAMRYGERLVEAWSGHDPDRSDLILRRLKVAAQEGAAAEMFRTPLQVTILVALFGRMSRAPLERWRLFRDYYATLYERELDRDHAAAEVLRRWRTAIDAVHAQAALHLQVMSEQGEARLTLGALRAIVRGGLAGPQGLQGDALDRAAAEIELAARERLVLLVENEPGWWSFELRSFQEFMAAEALLAAREMVGARLRAIASSPLWRNTLLFAISRLFAQPGELSEELVLGLCDELDADPPGSIAALTRPGAQLALDILHDGSATSFPRYVGGLVRRAFGVLDVPDPDRWQLLARVLGEIVRDPTESRELRSLVAEDLRAYLRGEHADHEAAWHALLNLEPGAAMDFVTVLADMRWPAESARRGELDPSFAKKALAVRYLRAHHTSTALQDAATWSSLRFPLPSPSGLDLLRTRTNESPGDDEIVELTHVAVRSLRGIDSLEIAPRRRQDGTAPWLVLIGENGVGKSTLLRALAFAMAPENVMGGVVARSGAPWCRGGSDLARVDVSTTTGTFGATLKRVNGHSELAQDGEGTRPFVVAYGCKRGSAFGGPEREVNLEPAYNVATLFEETAVGLVPASHWLTRRTLAKEQETDPKGEAHAILDAVIEVLCGPDDKRGTGVLEGVTRIEIRGDDVKLYGEGVGEAPVEALSDGYITMMGWTVDLMARWVEPRRKAGRAVPRRFNEVMTGLVLLDEIDLHLHPRWQYDVLARVRSFFPKMTFVVTTHNPTTLLGARPGEVHVMRREGERTRLVALDLPPGVRVDELLTGVWFGLATTTDPETLALYERHQKALRDGGSFGDPALRELEAELRRRLKRFGDTALERLAHNALAMMPRPAVGAPSPEARAAMQEHVRATLERESAARREAAKKTEPQ